MSMETPSGTIKTADKNIKDFYELDTISDSQQVLVVDGANNGKKIDFENVKDKMVSTDDGNVIEISATDNSLHIEDKVGDLDNLITRDKKNSVAAINEIVVTESKIGDLGEYATAVDLINVTHLRYMNEMGDRVDADEDLQEQISTLVNASEIKDIVGTYAALEAYDTSKLSTGDIIKVLKDETRLNALTYYKWDSTTSTFTYIGKDTAGYSKEEADDTFAVQTTKIQGQALSNNVVVDINSLNDVEITNPSIKDMLSYSLANWVNTPASRVEATWGGITGLLSDQLDLQEALDSKEGFTEYSALGNWVQTTMPASAYWQSVCYGNGKFVAVAEGTVAACSTDGINWTQTTMPSSANWYSVCYGDGKFVAVAYGTSTAAYSEDGINWTQTTMPSSSNWFSVCYGDGKFVTATIDYNIAAYSEDGINWTQTTLPTSASWRSVCYGDGKFVTVAYGSSIAAYSTDGINWTQTTLPAYKHWFSVCYGDGKFVTVDNDSSNIAAYSEDGINWTQTTLPASASWQSVCYGNGKFVAVAEGTVAAYSTDGVKNWTLMTMPSSSNWFSVCYGNGKFVAVAFSSAIAAYCPLTVSYKSTIVSSSSSHILLGSGTLIQWGKATRSSATQKVTLPYSYLNDGYTIRLQPYHGTASRNYYPPLVYESSNKTTTTFVANSYSSYTGFYWLTIGKGVVS